MEKWDIYDIDRNKKNKTIARGKEFTNGDFHLVVHICIINDEGEMLIQQRQPFKHGFSNLWDLTIGGSALAGENSQEAASRELFEEIGYSYDFSNTRPFFTVNFSVGFDDYYIIRENVDIEKLVLQEEEVQKVMWASEEEIIKMIDNKEFIPYYKNLIRYIFDAKDFRGAIYEEWK